MDDLANLRDGLTTAGHETVRIDDGGSLVVSKSHARIYGLSVGRRSPNLLWVDPELFRSGVTAGDVINGGDYLRFGPEYAHAWTSQPYDFEHLSNYSVQREEVPGAWLSDSSGELNFRQSEVTLTDHRDGTSSRFSVERSFFPLRDPLRNEVPAIAYMGYRTCHHIEWHGGTSAGGVDLWNLLQVPPASRLVLPVMGKPRTRSYFAPGHWVERPGELTWYLDGRGNSKIGLDAAQLPGRCGVLQQQDEDSWSLLIKQYPVYPGMSYIDGIGGDQGSGQCFQAWNGMGFGEVEYHGPGVGRAPLPREYHDTSVLWAYAGSCDEIKFAGRALLGVDLASHLT